MTIQQKIVAQYLDAMPCESYRVQVIHVERKPFNMASLSREDVLKRVSFLAAKNVQGFNVYCRPNSWRYVLVDDVKRDVLAKAAPFKPCLYLETSPDNFQVFFKLKTEPQTRDHAVAICRELCTLLDGDPGSAEPDHLGRLPTYTNRKAKYEKAGVFPQVKLCKAENRISTFSPVGACVKPSHTIGQNPIPSKNNDTDRSKEDFRRVCQLIYQHKTDSEIRAIMEHESEKAKDRKDDYIGRTIRNARRKALEQGFVLKR